MIETDQVRSVLIPLQGAQLLLPNAAVAEVATYTEPVPLPETPDWLLGRIEWRQLQVPLISFERIIGQVMEEKIDRQTRFIICYTLRGNAQIPYFAIQSSAIPHLVQVSKSNITPEPDAKEMGAEVLRQVRVNGEPALIPHLDEVEDRVLEVKGGM